MCGHNQRARGLIVARRPRLHLDPITGPESRQGFAVRALELVIAVFLAVCVLLVFGGTAHSDATNHDIRALLAGHSD